MPSVTWLQVSSCLHCPLLSGYSALNLSVSLPSAVCRGRYLVASRSLAQGEAALASEVYLSCIQPNWKKRVCARCGAVHAVRLRVHCAACGQAWYCDAACRAGHWAAGPSGLRRAVPHAAVCATLRHFSGLKCDSNMESALVMCLDALALLRQEVEQAADTCTTAAAPEPLLEHAGGSQAVSCPGAAAAGGATTSTAAGQAAGLLAAPRPPPQPARSAKGPHPGTGLAEGAISPDPAAAAGVQTEIPSPRALHAAELSQHAARAARVACGGVPAAAPSAVRNCPGAAGGWQPCALHHADFLRLQDLSGDFAPRDAADWLKALRLLCRALAAERWPQLPILGPASWDGPAGAPAAIRRVGSPCPDGACRAGGPTPDTMAWDAAAPALLRLVGRICANNFGVYHHASRAAPAGPGSRADAALAHAVQLDGAAAQPGACCGVAEAVAASPAPNQVAGGPGRCPAGAPDRAFAWPSAAPGGRCSARPRSRSPADERAPSVEAGQGPAGSGPACERARAAVAGPGACEAAALLERDAASELSALALGREAGSEEGRAQCGEGAGSPSGGASAGALSSAWAAHGAGTGAASSCDERTVPGGAVADGSGALVHGDGRDAAQPQEASAGEEGAAPRGTASPSALATGARETLIGRELHIAASFVNHACAPNCVLVREGGSATVVALRPIAVRPHTWGGMY